MAKRPVKSSNIPKAIVPIMQAFNVGSKEAARALLIEAAQTIYRNEFDFGCSRAISEDELDVIEALMRGIAPKDTIETLMGAQIVLTHFLGIRRLGGSHIDDQRLGLNLLQFSSLSMQALERKRRKDLQNNETSAEGKLCLFQA